MEHSRKSFFFRKGIKFPISRNRFLLLHFIVPLTALSNSTLHWNIIRWQNGWTKKKLKFYIYLMFFQHLFDVPHLATFISFSNVYYYNGYTTLSDLKTSQLWIYILPFPLAKSYWMFNKKSLKFIVFVWNFFFRQNG